MLRTFSGRKPSQHEFELEGLVKFIQERGLYRYLEIGARHGDTFHHVIGSLPSQGAFGLAIDLPGAKWGVSNSALALQAAIQDLRARAYAVDYILGDSTDAVVIETVQARSPFDIVLIDGDHRYEGVSQDFRSYAPMSRYVAFHDISGFGQTTRTPERLPVQVPKFWAEISTQFPCWEFIATGSTMGIGIVQVQP